MKKLLYAVCAIAFAAALAAGASATSYNDVDMDYTGVLGSYYENENDTAQDAEKLSRFSITSDISYSPTERLYYYSVADIALPFRSNVMDGMITNEKVTITVPDGIVVELYRNGVLCSDDLSAVTAPGSYILRVKTNAGISASVLSFTIIGTTSGAISGYTMPEGFTITRFTFNESNAPYTANYADFSEDGDYSLEYRCSAANIIYTLNFKADHSAPELKLEALKNGKSWGPVDISDVEQGGSVAVYRNGTPEPYTPQLTKSGQYEIVVSDAAGNKTSYAFTIMIYFNSGALVFFLAIAAILISVTVYVIIAGKKLRIR